MELYLFSENAHFFHNDGILLSSVITISFHDNGDLELHFRHAFARENGVALVRHPSSISYTVEPRCNGL